MNTQTEILYASILLYAGDKKQNKEGGRFMVLNATFNNTSAILWQSVLLMKETRVPGNNHRPAAMKMTNFIT